jgi:hypothetical protein
MMLSLVLTKKKTRKAPTKFVESSIEIQNGCLQNTKLRIILPEERKGSLVGLFAKVSTFSLSILLAITGDARIALLRSRQLLHQTSS